jgi:hypothetical protein
MHTQNARTDVSTYLFYFFLILLRAYASSRATCTHKTHAQMCVRRAHARHAHTKRTHRCEYAPLSRLLFHQSRALWSDPGSSHTAPAAICTLGSRELKLATALSKPQLLVPQRWTTDSRWPSLRRTQRVLTFLSRPGVRKKNVCVCVCKKVEGFECCCCFCCCRCSAAALTDPAGTKQAVGLV